jgi:RNA polymerase sigma-70 factor (ECF subfamily)
MVTYSILNDQDLTALLRESDEHAFEQLFLNYSPQIYKKLLKLVKQEAVAEELLQDVFVRIWEKRKEIDVDKSFRSYLYRIAQNLVTDLFRRAAFDRKMLADLINNSTEIYDPVEDAYTQKDHAAILKEIIDVLPAQRKRVYTLVKIDGKSYEEAAALLGISTSTISDHIVKANQTLKENFGSSKIILVALIASIIIS